MCFAGIKGGGERVQRLAGMVYVYTRYILCCFF